MYTQSGKCASYSVATMYMYMYVRVDVYACACTCIYISDLLYTVNIYTRFPSRECVPWWYSKAAKTRETIFLSYSIHSPL